MDLRPKFAPLEIRFVHRKLGLPGRLIVGFQSWLTDRTIAKIKHAGQRGQYEHFRFFAEEEGGFDIDGRHRAIAHDKLIPSRHTFTVQQRIEFEKVSPGARFAHPELAKIWEFFRPVDSRVDCQPARRKPPMKTFRDCPEIAGPEKRHEFILKPRLRRRHERLKSDKSLVAGKTNRLIIIEIIWRKRDISEAILLDIVKNHPSLVIVSRVKKAEPVR